MGLFSRAYKILSEEIYDKVPEVGCRACGNCCVSPHVTLIEFCYLFKSFLDNNPEKIRIFTEIMPIHRNFEGSLYCRFQKSDGKCGVYAHRPLVCRLHGHPALSDLGFKYHVPCPVPLEPENILSKDSVDTFLDHLSNLNQRFYLHYTHPYWLSALNVECWLKILFGQWERAYFQSLKGLMVRELGESVLEYAHLFHQNVRLEEKLDLIDAGHAEFQLGRKKDAHVIFKKIQDGFPETGAYYYFEAEMFLFALEGKMARAEDLFLKTKSIISS